MVAMAHAGTRRRPNPGDITPSKRPASVTPEDRKVQIAAAKARVTLDARIGVETPDWIIALSLEEPE